MTQSDLKKWETLLENQESFINNESTNNEFNNIAFPMAQRVFAKTLANDLIFDSEEEVNEVKQRIDAENREGSIDSIIEDKEFKEKKYEDDKEYKELMKKGVKPMSAPSGQLFYLDFKYSPTQSNTND